MDKKTNVIFGDKTEKHFLVKSYITDTLDGIEFKISLRSFYQVNPVQTEDYIVKHWNLQN